MFRVHVLNQGIDQFFNIDICVIATRGYGLASLAARQALGDATRCCGCLGYVAEHDMLRVSNL